jgi:hypothetical protein
MDRKGIAPSIIVAVIVVAVVVVGAGIYVATRGGGGGGGGGEKSGLTSHDPIYINGNSGFTAANGVVAGSGTAGDPYIIEG